MEADSEPHAPRDGTPFLMEPLRAKELARQFDLQLAAVWRGEMEADNPFIRWLDSFWGGSCPMEPSDYPDAVSHLGGGGRGIRWY
jgi:hypothetical protein